MNDNKINDVIIDENKNNNDKKFKKIKKFHPYLLNVSKIILGLYVISVIIGLNEVIMTLSFPMLTAINDSIFMSGEFKIWADVILGPFRFMLRIILWLYSLLLLNFSLFFIMKKIKWLSEKDIKIFFIMTIIISLLTL